MKLVLQIRLFPTQEQADLLKDTISTFNEACNTISQIAWERKVFSQFKLHHETYYAIKETYNLSSQLTIRAISKVADSYKLDKKRQRKFREYGSITYDSRIISYKGNTVSMSTIGGREKISFICHRQDFIPFIKGEADLVFRKGKFYLYQTIDVECEEIKMPDKFIGVDMGVTDIIAVSDGTLTSSDEVRRIRDRYNRTRASVQSKGTRSCHKLLKRLSGKEKRFATIVNHTISKQLVEKAKAESKGIAIEDLTNICKRICKQKRSKAQRREISSWTFHQLRSFLEYKCAINGIMLSVVPPVYTSQTCNRCMHIGERHGKSFKCAHCGNISDADINAAKNIATWGYVNTHEGWDLLSCSIHDDYSTSKVDKYLFVR